MLSESTRAAPAVRGRLFGQKRFGAVVVLAAVFMIVLLGIVAFAVDTGYILTVSTELKRSADAGALAGAGVLIDGTDKAVSKAQEYVTLNNVASAKVDSSNIVVQTGGWDPINRQFIAGLVPASAIRVNLMSGNKSLFFGGLLGQSKFNAAAEAIAVYQPRDIMVVLDYSGSMTDDSKLSAIPTLGKPAIEANLTQIYGELGSPKFGLMQLVPVLITSTDNKTVKRLLGLDKVAYPYPAGSWDEYIDYVQTNTSLASLGYQNLYGYLTWIDYTLNYHTSYAETPVLWKVTEQPLTALKNSVQMFLVYLQQVTTADRVGMVIYCATDGTAKLETGLTSDCALVESISRTHQAGHYMPMTNIGAGIKKGREEIIKNGRVGSLKLMILMTDGIPNLPWGTDPRAYTLSEAKLTADAKIPIVCISLGVDADTALMQQIADMTGGVHFNVPGGRPMSEVEDALNKVFRQVAEDRPLKLVK